ncbi:Protein CFAP20DC [Plecturocebus cupreus]
MGRNQHKKNENTKNQNASPPPKDRNSSPARYQRWMENESDELTETGFRRDWLNMLSPPIVPPSQQPAEQHPDSSESLSAQGEEDLSVEEDEEVLTLLYDPCLNCYFDPQTGKYYELGRLAKMAA